GHRPPCWPGRPRSMRRAPRGARTRRGLRSRAPRRHLQEAPAWGCRRFARVRVRRTMAGTTLRGTAMPVHDWTRVDAGIFHDFHTVWIGQIRTVLNDGLLPQGYYALAEQHAGRSIADVLTLHAGPGSEPASQPWPLPPDTGGIAVADAPPRT